MAITPMSNNDFIQDKVNETIVEINANKNQIEAVEQSVTALDTKLSVDYVIDFGSNSNGSWEKWHSGKLVQKTKLTLTYQNNRFLQSVWTYPKEFNPNKPIYGFINAYASDITASINNSSPKGSFGGTSATLRAYGTSMTAGNTLDAYVMSEGYWK